MGDRRVRVERPHAAYFRWKGPGQLTAKEAASRPTTRRGQLWAAAKAFVIGRPLASEAEIGERLSKKKALAIFSSDAISSSAYATEEILFVAAAGTSSLALGLDKLVPIAIVVAVLLSGCVRSIQYLALNTISYADVPRAMLSRSTSVGGVVQQLARGFGVAVGAALLAMVAL